ncbi:MAG: hypothetical protein U9N77_12945 [Thermodesulfobacteriota bacterium]|nr:hypothetical protein [Thermodesulfobacteriota bacterium]
MRLRLNLDNHCIETGIKKLYNKKVSACLKTGVFDKKIEQEIESLKYALENFDFPLLRSEYRALAGTKKARVFIVVDGCGVPGIEIDGERIKIKK